MGRIAIIAGAGVLPGLLTRALEGAAPLVCAPEGVEVDVAGAERFRLERLVPFLMSLQDRGVTGVVMGGAMQRPTLDPAQFDPATAQVVPRLLAAMQAGDDATLRAVIGVIEDCGLTVHGLADLAPGLIPEAGVLTLAQPSAADARDAERAARIVAVLGAADVGQGAVVAQGLCLAVETLPGTDAMLDWVAALGPGLRPDPKGARGLLYKAPKPGQDLRVDLPALGPATVARAQAAGLAGIAWAAGGVLLLDREATAAAADAAGLFLWARRP